MTADLWLVLDMDEGVLGAYRTLREAMAEHAWGPVLRRHRYGKGGYEYLTGYPPDDTTSFFVERESIAPSNGWDLDAWIAAGRPVGRLTDMVDSNQSRLLFTQQRGTLNP